MKKINYTKLFSKDTLVLLGLWLVVTLFNFFKAFHIDDTFHLEAGMWIAENWLNPLSGQINWDNNFEYMHRFNQPVLFFYLVAVVGSIFSFTELPMHALLSVFSLISIVYFYKTMRFLYPKSSLGILVLFVLCPAFLVNQNAMTDIPLLAFMLGFVYHLLLGRDQHSVKNYCLAGCFLSLGLLTKYTILPLLLVFAFVLLVRKHFRLLWCLGIPLGVVALWSFWNVEEYGSVHILGRSTNSFSFKYFGSGMLSYLGCLAAILPLHFIAITHLPKKYGCASVIAFTVIMISLPIAFSNEWVSELSTLGILNMVFTILGLILMVYGLFRVINYVLKHPMPYSLLRSPQAILLVCFVGLMLFVVLFAPFMATRHVLLTVPFLLLLFLPVYESSASSLKAYLLALTVALGGVLGVSDYCFAEYYRTAAKNIPKSTDESRVWSVGHWGWQWYSAKQGARIYSRDKHEIKKGDRVVMPLNVAAQDIHPSVVLEAVDSLYSKPNGFTFFSVHNHGSMYTSRYKKTAWTFSKQPIDTIVIYTVKDVDFKSTLPSGKPF